ncbi:MAG TPA: winged helix-turn-helix domain-containing protein [Nitrosopumilaceae archaeon]|nr:winged helix-turn-helix domain-containing protein [Nitrosopumilaceae archaeon]
MKYGGKMEIIAMILQTAVEGTTKTRIMYAAYLSFQQVKDYLDFLQENDLILYENETGFYKLTEKGNRFLRISNELNDLFSFKNSEFNNSFGV